jgi:hypothetical protein
MMHPDKGGTDEVPRELLRQLAARVVLARQRKNRSIYDFGKNFRNLILGQLSHMQKQGQGGAKNCLCRGKTSVFPPLGTESEEDPGDLLSPSSLGSSGTKRILEAMMQSFDCAVCLRMVSSGLAM